MTDNSGSESSEVIVRHWADIVSSQAEELFGKNQVIMSGWSPSGLYHVGNFREAATCHAIYTYMKDKGLNVKFVLVIDDLDPLDKVPSILKKYKGSLKPYLGHPVNQIPDFTKEHETYAQHFAQGVYEARDLFGFKVELVNASDLYKQGKYDPYVKIYYEKKSQVQALMEQISGNPMEDFLSVQCQNCKSITNPRVTSIDLEHWKVTYECVDTKYRKGCGHKQEASLRDLTWKLKWRLDWPSRQDFYKVTVEPAGKDHSVAGGSIDTTIAIHKNILGKQPPIMVRYGFITFGGKKLSGSSGLGIPASEAGKFMPPPAYLFMIYRNDLTKDFSFNPSSLDLPKTVDDYDEARRLYLGLVQPSNERAAKKLIVSAQVALPEKYKNVPPPKIKYLDLATIFQVSLGNNDLILKKLKQRGIITETTSDLELQELQERITQVQYWLENYAPENVLFKIIDDPNQVNTEKINLEYLKTLVKNLEQNNPITLEDVINTLQATIQEIGQGPKPFYQTLYQALIGKDRGPKISSIIENLGVKKTISLLQAIINQGEN